MNLANPTIGQVDDLDELRRLMLALEMAIDGSSSLDPHEREALDTLTTLVNKRMAALCAGVDPAGHPADVPYYLVTENTKLIAAFGREQDGKDFAAKCKTTRPDVDYVVMVNQA